MKNLFAYIMVGIISSAIVAMIFTCDNKEIQQVDDNVMRREITDSINAIYAEREITKLDSLREEKDSRINRLKKENASLKAIVADRVEVYQADTTQQTPKCDSVISAYIEYTDTLQATIRQYDTLSVIQDSTISFWMVQTRYADNNYRSATKDIISLQRELAKKNTWWAKNEKWIYLIGGFVAMGFVAQQ